MDEGNRSTPRPVGEDITRERGCRSCAVAQWVAGDSTRSEGSYVAEDVDENVVVIRGPDFDGLVVVPRQHISGIWELPVPRRARLLAALQRATRSVRERYPGMATSVVVMTDPPASEGHACFHVLPSASEDPVRSFSTPA